MGRNFLNFVQCLLNPECPWSGSGITTHSSYIELRFFTSCIVKPADLGWLNTHANGGEWFITSDHNYIQVVVRFHKEDDEV